MLGAANIHSGVSTGDLSVYLGSRRRRLCGVHTVLCTPNHRDHSGEYGLQRGRPEVNDQAPVLQPLSEQILRVIAKAGLPIAPLAVFKVVAQTASASCGKVDLALLLAEVRRLEDVGMVVQVPSQPDASIQIACTVLGHRVAGVAPRASAASVHSRSRTTALVTSASAVALGACAVAAPENVESYGATPLGAASAEQVRVHGSLTWAACGDPDDCPGPTPKTLTFAVASARPTLKEQSSAPTPPPLTKSASLSDQRPAATTAPSAAPPQRAEVARAPIARAESISIFFDTGQATLSRHEQEVAVSAAAHARKTVSAAAVKVVVIGMTDRTGTSAGNQQLSQRRADHVRLLLSDGGVDLGRITTQIDTSSTRPVPDQALPRQTPGGSFAPYRRVDVVITTDGVVAPGPTANGPRDASPRPEPTNSQGG